MRSLQLVLPSLARAQERSRGNLTDLPASQRLLARAGVPRSVQRDRDVALLQAFGVAQQQDWPVAPFTYLADGGALRAGYCLRADPVHLRAERDALVLVDGRHFDLGAQAAAELIAALNRHFEDDGIAFFGSHPYRWYAVLPAVPDLTTCPLEAAAGRNIDALLPAGGEALAWHRRCNEIQMLFHSHPVNEAREEAAEPVINSVWLWGGGALPASARPVFASVAARDPLAAGLALASSTPLRPPVSGAADWLSAAANGAHLVVLDPIASEAGREHLEQSWFQPLLQALRSRQLERLAIVLPDGERWLEFELSPHDLWKFWRRSHAGSR